MIWSVLLTTMMMGSPEPAAQAGASAEPVRDLNTHHCLVAPPSLGEWERRARFLRTQILTSAGLWPMPERTPLNPIVTGRIEREDFIVEKVSIETLPGFRLCGNLYRPKGKRGPFPAIANPHGHWSEGRLGMQEDVPIAEPPPAKPAEGRANLPAIGVDLARAGFVVFAYDMVGYNDTNQVNHQWSGSLERWFRGVSLMGLQLWNSIRAVDYLCSLPDVDPKRIGATGASGGGTQTFLLAAVDERVRAAVPVNMVSASMQGGCLCENGPGLRLNTDNVEIAALTAPRDLLLIAATGDWTKNNPVEEWPAIRAVYDLYGVRDRTECVQFNYGHNYNVESREAMVGFFLRRLGKGSPEPFKERPFQLTPAEMRVWAEQTPPPAGLLKDEELAAAMAARAREALLRVWPRNRNGLARFRDLMRPALAAMLGFSEAPLVQNPGAPRSGSALLILVPEKGGEDTGSELAQAAGKRYSFVLRIRVPVEEIDPSAWWKDYRSCYNPTPLARACTLAFQEIRRLADEYGRVDAVGLGDAGPVVLLARAVLPVRGALAVQLTGVTSPDALPIQRYYVPSFAGLGGFGTCLALAAPSPTILVEPSPQAEKLLPGGASAAALNVTRCGARPEEILAALDRAKVR